MIKAFFSIAFRNLERRKTYSLLNLMSLSVGLTSVLIVILYINHELSFDHFHHDTKNTYRIAGKDHTGWFPSLSRPYTESLMDDHASGIKTISRLRKLRPGFVKYGDKKLYENKFLATDPGSDFFKIFNYKLIEGQADQVLSQPNSVIISTLISKKYFNTKSPIGEHIIYDTMSLTVTGVFEEIPSNSHLEFDFLITNKNAMERGRSAFTYCVLESDADIQNLSNQILSLPVSNDHFKVEEIKFQPLADLHFSSNMTFEIKPPGSYTYLTLFTGIGVLILIISCINYVNLSIAIYSERGKEIAIRKVNGAQNLSLALHFLGESILFSMLCIPITLALLQLILPRFNTFMNIHLENHFVFSFQNFSILFLIVFVVGLLSGLYPALALPRLKAVSLFKGNSIVDQKGLSLRKALVAFQFSMLILLVSGSWMINNQLEFINQKDLGFTKEGVIKIANAWTVDSSQYQKFKSELLQHSKIISVSEGTAPGDQDYGYEYRTEQSPEIQNDLIYIASDYDYIKTLGIQMVSKEFNLKEGQRPKSSILINETLAKKTGGDPIGKKIILFPGSELEQIQIVNGVFRDYNFFSLHQSIPPQMLLLQEYSPAPGRENVLVKIEMENASKTLAFIQKKVESIAPNEPIHLKFLDEDLNRFYEHEQKLSSLSSKLLFVSLFLAISGLVGLTSYMTALRTKEIGVRKILGASTLGIISLLAQSFLFIISFAVLTGSLISYTFIQMWLKSFAFKAPVQWQVFIVSGSAIIIMAMITMTFQAAKAARANPIDSLKSD